MAKVPCSCGAAGCQIQIRLGCDDDMVEFWFTDKNGDETLMYLDANATVALIRALRERLIQLSGTAERNDA